MLPTEGQEVDIRISVSFANFLHISVRSEIKEETTMCICILAIISIFIGVFIGVEATERDKYIGCYENHPKTQLLSQYVESSDHFTPFNCVDLCHSRQFAYAGLQKNECRCGQNVPPEIIRRSDLECDYLCLGDNEFRCGGEFKTSIYETGVIVIGEDAMPDKIYLGCYTNLNGEFQLLNGSFEEFTDNSPTKCHINCYKQGFRYFGLSDTRTCFCGDNAPSTNAIKPEEECDNHCNADSDEICGGRGKISLYATGISDIPEYSRYIGCFKNTNGSEIPLQAVIDLRKSNSNRRCLNICDQKGFMHAGVQKGTQCSCTNEVLHPIFREDDYVCEIDTCPGNVAEKCGAKDMIKVFRTRHTDYVKPQGFYYMGCFKDHEKFHTVDENREIFESNLTRDRCIETCVLRGYAFSGVEFGKECFCSHSPPSVLAKVDDTECHTPCSGNPSNRCGGPNRIGVYENGLPHPQAYVHSFYLGCFTDNRPADTTRRGYFKEFDNLSPSLCHQHCLQNGFKLFSLSHGKECYCNDEEPPEDLSLSEDQCQKPCLGDPNKICGGEWKLDVFATGLLDIETDLLYKGCFENNGALLIDKKIEMVDALNPKRCQSFCDMLGFLYSAVQRGIECRCGNHFPNNLLKETDDKCDTKCPDHSGETCGKKNFMKVYRTTVTNPYGFSADALVQSWSLTTKNKGQQTSKGEQIFADFFDKLNTSVWSHSVKIAPEPDNEFVIYDVSDEVVFVKSGKLFIKPKIQPDNFINSSITLKNCTGKLGTSECSKKAQSFSILPPVLSGQLTTSRSFSFRYGKVNVRAKLPIGDWILPQIMLTPKENSYGEFYQSGQIRIVMSRGNQELNCSATYHGYRRLATGIYFGPDHGVMQKVFYKSVPHSWTNEFHNYTVIWTPDSIAFQIDGEDLGKIMVTREHTIRQIIGLPKNTEYTYRNGSKLAPFDKEFSITLGVSVGGITDFPDTCTSKGQKKPWSNYSPKSMLEFWKNKEQWKTTWQDDKISLQVEHVKVWAL